MIHCQSLCWGAPGQPLTPPLTLRLESASLTAIVGPNGCGKSSLLKTLAGLQTPLSGKATVSVPRLGGLSFLPQQQQLDRQFPINLQDLIAAGFWGRRLSTRLRKQRMDSALEDWHLSGLEKRPLIALSGGELQRALLARLSLTDTPILLLDEPDAALDELGQRLLWHHLKTWHAQGRTIALVCHDLAAVREHIPHTLLIKSSGCLFGESTELLRQSTDVQVA